MKTGIRPIVFSGLLVCCTAFAAGDPGNDQWGSSEPSDPVLQKVADATRAKDWPRARVEMLEAIRHDPQDADAHNGLGYALEKLGDLDGALKEYRTATHLDPDDSSYQHHYLDALGKIAARPDAENQKKKR